MDKKRNELYKTASDKCSKELSVYKGMMQRTRDRGITYKVLSKAVDGIFAYIRECEENEETVAISGIQLASGLTRSAYEKARAGEYDFLIARAIEQENVGEIDEEGYGIVDGERVYLSMAFPYSAIIERAELVHEFETEKRLNDNKRKNVVADIFTLKAKHGWQEEESKSSNSLTINVASLEEAKKSLALLKDE